MSETNQPKKRPRKTSPMQRSLKAMRDRGYYAEVVERRNPVTRILNDFAGFIDILCLGENEVVGVQSTTTHNLSARINKIADHENVGIVRKAGIRILAHGWQKGSNGRWQLTEKDVS